MLSTLVELKKYSILNYIFGFIFLNCIIGEYYNLQTLVLLVKPFITLSLAVALWAYTKLKGKFHKRIFIGLILSLTGDCLLMLSHERLFLYGLLAFFLCHSSYVRAFYLDFRSAPELDKKNARITVIIGAMMCTSFFFFIRPYLGNMRVPVLAYCLVITFMGMMAAFRNKRVNKTSFQLIMIGALFFYLSDFLLVVNRFVNPFERAHVVIISTYMLAQYFIVIGAIDRRLLINNN
ncbi:MAG: lysoplasmalogenase [Bacteroidota bacterium]